MKDTCTVSNKSAGVVMYSIPDMNINRSYAAHETKKNISVKELEQLSQQPGGKDLLYHYLMVHDPEIINYLINGEAAPEYWLEEKDIPNWMQTCSLDEFKDALDYAPDGTKDLIKNFAVSLPLNDFSKREAIKAQLGFDVSKAIELTTDPKEEEEKKKAAAAAPTGRRTTSSISVPTTDTKIVVPAKEK